MRADVVAGLVAAVLVFWAVGAYNRLVRLRAAINRAFTVAEEQLRRRHALLGQWLDSVAPAFGTDAREPVEALLAACNQAVTACEHAKRRPGASRPMASLRVADDVLRQARRKADAAVAALGPDVRLAGSTAAFAAVCRDLIRLDGAMGHARHQFNAAAAAYNAAVRQFPTWLLARLFGFRRAGEW